MLRNTVSSILLLLFCLPAGPILTGETLNEINDRWNELRSRKAWAAAEELLIGSIVEHPDTEWLYTNLSRALREQKKFDEAIDVALKSNTRFDSSQRSRSALAIGYIKRGTAIANQKEYDTALRDFRAAYDLLPDTDYVILNYAIALSNVEKYTESLALYRSGVTLHPGYEPLKRNLVWALVRNAQALWDSAGIENQSSEAAQKDARVRAFALAKEAYATDPAHQGALQIYGRALLKEGQADEAIPILLQGHEQFPELQAFCWPLSQAYRVRIGQLYQKNPEQNRERALQVAREIPKRLRGEPRCDNSLLFAYDSVYAMLGAFDESIPVLEKLARRYPQHSIYPVNAGEHMNRYAVWLHTVQKDATAAKAMRDRANILLRMAMDIYEKNNPDRAKPAGPVRFPLKGLTLVLASFDSGGTHSGYGKYCYDLIIADERGSMVRPGTTGKANEDFFGFGAPVHAVRDGVVDEADDGDPDGRPGVVQYQNDGNFVRVRHADGTFASYVHLKNGSLRVQPGQKIRAGQPIGALGNSGMSVSPHLHFCLMSDDYVSLDFRFETLKARRAPAGEAFDTNDILESGWLVEP